ncbi:MAG TPA: dihydrofolate reductase family protein [Terriglobales bacterium]|nr:dihydrofolate reductase family protein [Terriglobales bacterium]
MRRLMLKMSVSIDGFVGGPQGEVDWVFRHLDDAATAWTVETISHVGLHIMGSRTFQDMVAWWPTSTEVFAPPMNAIPKAVFTRKPSGTPLDATTTTALKNAAASRGGAPDAKQLSPDAASWAAAYVASGDLATEIAALKRQPGKDMLAHGGASFARSLVRLGLIDEYRLLVHPVALGQGLPLFAELEQPRDLKLVSVTAFAGGCVAHVYRPN